MFNSSKMELKHNGGIVLAMKVKLVELPFLKDVKIKPKKNHIHYSSTRCSNCSQNKMHYNFYITILME